MAKDYIICPKCERKIHFTYWKCPWCEAIIHQSVSELDEKTKNYKPDDLDYGWIWYIIIMFFSLFFKQWYIAWIAATYIFFTWRKQKFDEMRYGGNSNERK